ncbi:MAG: gliding motility-associated C-terminal domain-containing protein [Saprospiraceae bacterium]|nr:gliding motility-associated C-terminal domain-containing protein [Saprospiraceae bacterium]
MNRLLFVFAFCCLAAVSHAQNCQNLNFPAAPADSCEVAPLLCGNYLEQYCGSNAGLTDDAFGLASGFLRFSSCFEEASLQVQVFNCSPGSSGLIFSIREEDCNPQSAPLATGTILANTTDTLSATNLSALLPYVLAVSGLQGSQCDFNIQVLGGVGTALPGLVSCQCTGGGIEGPDHICSGAPVMFSFEGLACNFTFGLPVGGNGEYCPPQSACPGSLDSIVIEWHIPDVMHFVGDSTGAVVTIALDSNYMGLDTLRFDSVWVTWKLVSTTPVDSLAFCDCAEVNCSGGAPLVFPITIGFEQELYACELSCATPVCVVRGIEYTSPGGYSYVDGCLGVTVSITQKFEEPIVLNHNICLGDVAFLEVINYDTSFTYTWSTGAVGPSISVSPMVTTTYTVTAVHSSGNCIFSSAAVVMVTPPLQQNVGQVGVLTCLTPCINYFGTNYCQPGQYQLQIPGCIVRTFSIGSDPTLEQIVQPTVTICEGQCVDFFGQQICSSQLATHTQNCTTYTRQIIVIPRDTIFEGVVGTVTCEQPCFTYNGVEYCAPGQYKTETVCETRYFQIGFQKKVTDLGMVGLITCKEPCLMYNGTEYCEAKEYQLEDSCEIRIFRVDSNFVKPSVEKPVIDCSPANTHFTVAFTISGLPPFRVDEENLTGSVYLSDPLPNGSDYAFIVKHDNGCEIIVSGTYDCAQFCASTPGKLSDAVLHGCAGQTSLAVVSVQPPNLAPGDVLVYHLQTADGHIVASNDSGAFSFDPATMDPEETYFASCVVGPADVNGLPNPTDVCTDTSTQQPMIFHQLPAVMVNGDTSLCELDAILLMAGGAETYLWNTGNTTSELEIPAAEPEQTGWYKVRGWSEYQCFADDSLFVEVFPSDSKNCCKPQIPNAFTPNGDGANDGFMPLVSDCSPLVYAELRIYSRWGDLVFRSDKEKLRWDGNYPGGDPAGSDTYVFTFRYRLSGEDEKTEKGEITLLR